MEVYMYTLNPKLNVELRPQNTSNVYYTGSKWKNNTGQKFTIIGQTTKEYIRVNRPNEFVSFVIAFENGFQNVVSSSMIKIGSCKNYEIPSLCNFGFEGYARYLFRDDPMYKRHYKLWHSIIVRCYSESQLKKAPQYRDTIVADRWRNFEVFFKDVVLLPGYEKWKNLGGTKYNLDKDLKSTTKKVYSPETCLFLPRTSNLILSNRTGKIYQGTRLSDGYTEIFINQRQFCKKYKLVPTNVLKAIKGIYKSSKGWVFKVVSE